MIPPLVLRAVLTQPAQSESVNVVTMDCWACHGKWYTSLGAPAKYLPIFGSIFQ